MHTLQWARPSFQLRDFVRAYAQRETDAASEIIEPIPARLEQTLEFQFGCHFDALYPDGGRDRTSDAMIVGAHVEGPMKIVLHGRVESFGVFFQPTGFSRLFGVPVHELAQHAYPASCVIGAKVLDLRFELGECPSFEGRIAIVEAFLARYASRASIRDPINAVADQILRAYGTVPLNGMAQQVGLGERQFERRFLQNIGITPKRFARVARFQSALDNKIAYPGCPWIEIAHRLRYHDQMHMVRDFHDLAGEAPTKIFAGIGDARPVAFADSNRRSGNESARQGIISILH